MSSISLFALQGNDVTLEKLTNKLMYNCFTIYNYKILNCAKKYLLGTLIKQATSICKV